MGLRIDAASEGTHIRVGTSVYIGVPVTADGAGVITLVNAQVDGIPSGLEIVAIAGQRPDTHLPGHPRFVGIESEAALRTQFPLFRPVRLGEVRIDPNRRAGEPGWALVIQARATRPGRFVTGGLSVTASQGGVTDTIHARFTLEIDVQAPTSRPDMSRPVHLLADCPGSEAPIPSTWQGRVDRAVKAGGGEALVRMTLTNAAVSWNTPDGHRPTQREVDAGLQPSLYEVEHLRIEAVIAGHIAPGPATGLLLGGESGMDSEGGCSLAIDERTDGSEFLLIFGPTLPYDQQAPHPILEVRDLAAVHGGLAATPYGAVSVPK